MATDDHMTVTAVGLPVGALSATFGKYVLENGQAIEDVVLGYSTYGTLNETGDNAVIVGHSLTSNSNVLEWWSALMGEGDGMALDTKSEFIVCVNYLASPYGSSSPVTPDPGKRDGKSYAADFPTPITVRDNVRLQRKLCDKLGVRHLKMAIGGSMGSMLALEWAATFPDFVTELVLIAGCGRHTDWAIGIGEAQRFSIMADSKFKGGEYDPTDPPRAGLATSRMMAMLSYRAPQSMDSRFNRDVMNAESPQGTSEDSDDSKSAHEKKNNKTHMRKPSSHVDIGAVAHANELASETLPYFAVESYLQYQGKKFVKRFDANCYIQLTYTLDSHDVARGRGAYEDVLRRLTHRTLVVGITSDVLYPFSLQSELAQLMPHAEMYAIDSPHGHDAFLIEIEDLNLAVARFRRGEPADPVRAMLSNEAPNDLPNASNDLNASLNSERELRGAVRALELELEKSREEKELHQRRADSLLQEVARLRVEVEVKNASVSGNFDEGTYGYGLLVVPANPPPSSRRFKPVYGEVESSIGGTDAPIAALGAF
jgi:homoserine O-acetyltransferase